MATPEAPSSETALWISQHTHTWERVGSYGPQSPEHLSWWHPAFRCTICTDVIVDVSVRLPEGQECPEEDCIDRAGHSIPHFDGFNRKWD